MKQWDNERWKFADIAMLCIVTISSILTLCVVISSSLNMQNAIATKNSILLSKYFQSKIWQIGFLSIEIFFFVQS